ncbi:hypothetical protein [Bradyrhizobium sp. B117]|uniref:hypothetical protein n=1 Tax=Bradyrhizobium sp. B117 TaxID=3140246 RepID=UPI003182FF9F
MQLSLRLLIVLLATAAALAMTPEALENCVLLAGAGLLLITTSMAYGADLTAALEPFRRLRFAIAFPAIWMTLQILPLPLSAANPIWRLTSNAFGDSHLWGHISIDPSRTFASLMAYLGVFSITVSASLIARDRRRAETAFLALFAMTSLLVAVVALSTFTPIAILPSLDHQGSTALVAWSGLSVVLGSAMVVMTLERHFTRREASHRPTDFSLAGRLFLTILAIAISVAALASIGSTRHLIPTAAAVYSIFFVAIARRLGARPWPAVILFSIFALLLAAMSFPYGEGPLPFAFGLSSENGDGALTIAMRALTDTPWVGHGVGTFTSLARVYADIGISVPVLPPTTAALVAIEWGIPALVALILASIQLIVFLFRGAIRRGRDSYFPSASSASLLCLGIGSFLDIGLLSPLIWVVAAVLVGIGLAQSSGRTSSLDS